MCVWYGVIQYVLYTLIVQELEISSVPEENKTNFIGNGNISHIFKILTL